MTLRTELLKLSKAQLVYRLIAAERIIAEKKAKQAKWVQAYRVRSGRTKSPRNSV